MGNHTDSSNSSSMGSNSRMGSNSSTDSNANMDSNSKVMGTGNKTTATASDRDKGVVNSNRSKARQ